TCPWADGGAVGNDLPAPPSRPGEHRPADGATSPRAIGCRPWRSTARQTAEHLLATSAIPQAENVKGSIVRAPPRWTRRVYSRLRAEHARSIPVGLNRGRHPPGGAPYLIYGFSMHRRAPAPKRLRWQRLRRSSAAVRAARARRPCSLPWSPPKTCRHREHRDPPPRKTTRGCQRPRATAP